MMASTPLISKTSATCGLSEQRASRPQVAEVFEISGVDAIIEIHPSAESAAERLMGG